MKIMKFFLRCIPALIITAVSWYLSDQSTIEHMPRFFGADKIVHFVCFGGLAFWVSFGCGIKKLKQIWCPSLIVSVYGIIDEIHQSFVPGRSASVYDWLADTTGALMGSCIFIFVLSLIIKFMLNQHFDKTRIE